MIRIQIKAVAIFVIIFGAQMNILIIIKVRILFLIDHIGPPSMVMLTVEPRIVNHF